MRHTAGSGMSIRSRSRAECPPAPGVTCVEVASPCAAVRDWVMVSRPPEAPMTSTMLLPFHPEAMTPAQLAAVSYLARHTGHTHALYAYQVAALVHLVPDQRP